MRKIILDNRNDAETHWPGRTLLDLKDDNGISIPNRRQCCIGIALSACGIPDGRLKDIPMPNAIRSTLGLSKEAERHIKAWDEPLRLRDWHHLERSFSHLMTPLSERMSFRHGFSSCSSWGCVAAMINDTIARGQKEVEIAAHILEKFLPIFAETVLDEEWKVEFIQAEKEE